MNRLYYGDNLDVLRRHVDDASVDLVYLDPPFNSNANYNVLFAEYDGTKAASQTKAFTDTWHWDDEAARSYEATVEVGGEVAQAMQAFRTFLQGSDMMAYLAMMAPRLIELRRVLKPTGSLYLHCDPTASHYLKMLLDSIFGPACFKNEISWRRTTTKGDYRQGATNYPRVRDVLLYYARVADAETYFKQPFSAYSAEYLSVKYRYRDAAGRPYRLDNLTAPGAGTRGHPKYEFMGVTKYWRYNKAKMEDLLAAGRVIQTKPGTVPQYKRYLDEMPGIAIGDSWDDIDPINSQAKERLHYPTQKPEALLERIIDASSKPGDTVLDPFCGCGTTVAAAQTLGRRWIGIDITSLAITLIRSRLADMFVGADKAHYEVVGEPVSLPDAAKLAGEDPYQFQWWALGRVDARPVEQKKGADRGIDGRIFFHVGDEKSHSIILSVKAGHVNVSHVRDLRGVLDREQAEIGVLISLEEPTGPMRKEAASAGFYTSPWGKHARLQLLTIEDLLTGKGIDRPPTNATFKKAPKAEGKTAKKQPLDFGAEPDSDEPF